MTENQAAMFAAAMRIANNSRHTPSEQMAALFFARDLEDSAAGIPCDCERSWQVTQTGHSRMEDIQDFRVSYEEGIDLDLHLEAEEDDHAQGR